MRMADAQIIDRNRREKRPHNKQPNAKEKHELIVHLACAIVCLERDMFRKTAASPPTPIVDALERGSDTVRLSVGVFLHVRVPDKNPALQPVSDGSVDMKCRSLQVLVHLRRWKASRATKLSLRC